MTQYNVHVFAARTHCTVLIDAFWSLYLSKAVYVACGGYLSCLKPCSGYHYNYSGHDYNNSYNDNNNPNDNNPNDDNNHITLDYHDHQR